MTPVESPVASGIRLLPWLLVFVLFVLPLTLSEQPSNLSSDEAGFYLPAVERIRGHWPALDLRDDSLSATAPGYPYLLATLSQVTGSARLTLRLLNLAVSTGVLVAAWLILRRSVASPALFLLPLALSNFFVKSSGYVVTDNAALLGIALTLAFTLSASPDRGSFGAAACAAFAVAVRQNSIWLLAPLAWKVFQRGINARRRIELLAPLLPVLVLACLLISWQGLVPPAWQTTEVLVGITFMPALYVLTMLAALGAPFYLAMTSSAHWREDFSSRWPWIAALIALAVAMTTNSLPDSTSGRWGGYWWNLASLFPSIGSSSLLFGVLAPIGAWFTGAAFHRLWREAGAVVAVPLMFTIFAWLATTLTNQLIFQRYYEPTVLLFLLCWAGLLASARTDKDPLRRWPLIALAAAQVGITLITAHAQAYGLFKP